MACTPATLKAELTAFASVADNTVQKWLDRAAKQLNPDTWEDLYDDGQMFLAAHMMVCMGLVTGVTASAGAVKSKTVGPVSLTFAVGDSSSASDNDLARTEYGRQYKALLATRYRGPMVL